MTPKEKAKELVEKYDSTLTYLESKSKAKQCALIAVDEIIYVLDAYIDPVRMYWEKVYREIQAL